MATIDNNNYELWLLQYAEGQLSDIERSEVEAWLVDHPEATEELALYIDAPRLEADPTVSYAAASPQRTRPLWPAVWRWSAAAAVLAALMLPALRMGTMGTLDPEPPLFATATIPQPDSTSTPQNTPKIQNTSKTPNVPIVRPNPVLLENALAAVETTDSIDAIDNTDYRKNIDTVEAIEPINVIYCNSLIVYEPPQDTIVTNTLVTYDGRRPTLPERAREWVVDSPLAQLFRK